MALAPGSRIGHYDIVAAIGAGGMGEVYRGRDTQLDRDVALKILPESFAADPDRLMRFTREARTLAALNHPNIAHIHGLEEAGGVRALVMELVEGEDLSQRIARGALPLDEALPIARQIAEALEAAHDQGIIHRDLKPANIKVRPDGTVKVLDFGLAKAMDGSAGPEGPASSSVASSPTMTSPALTAMGLILGTAAYMSPEQARGRTVDKRADIWAFGVVLHEMIGGAQLFQGETVSDVIAAVLRADIDLATLPATVPGGLRQLLARCLEKDPRRRLRDIGEARIWLESPVVTEDRPVAAATTPGGSRFWPWAAAVSSSAAAALAGWMLFSQASAPAPVRASIQLPPGTEYAIDSSTPPNLAISPDGSTIVFAATPAGAAPTATTLYVRRLDHATAEPLPDSAGGRMPFFSPDSRQVAFLVGSTMKKASLSGGAPSVVTTGVSNTWGSVWLPDGTIVFADPKPSGEMLYTVSENGGTAALLSRVERLDNDNSFPRLLDPDHLLVTMWTGGLYTDGKIFKYSRRDRKITEQLVEGGGQGYVVAGSHLVYARGSELLAQAYPAGAGRSGAVKVLDGVLTDVSYATAQFDVSQSGALVFAPTRAQAPSATVVWISANGTVETLFDDPNIEFPRLSADGRQVVYVTTQTTREKDLWTFDTTAKRRARLTSAAGEEYSPVISHDGTRVIFSAWRDKSGLYQTALRGSGEVRLNQPDGRAMRGWSLSSDGRWLVGTDDVPGGAFDRSSADIGVIDLVATPLETRWLTSTPFREDQAVFSPDGALIAYAANPLGTPDIWVLPFLSEGADPIPISREGGSQPFWSADGRTLYYAAGDSIMAVAVSRGPAPTFSEPTVVFTMPNLTVAGVAPDGRFLAVKRQREPVTRLEIILHWIEDIRQRVR